MACVPNGWPPAYWPSTCCTSNVTPVTFTYGPMTDAFGRLRVSQPYTLFDSQQRYSLDSSFVSNTATGGTVTYISNQSSANLSVTGTLGSYAARETRYVFTYQPGKSLLAMATFVMAPASDSNLRQRVGYFGKDNGIFLELRDQLYMVKRSNISGTIAETYVAQGDWNQDTLNGGGASGITLDITSAQIWWMDMEWLGVGSVRTGFVIDGQFVVCHIFHHANTAKSAYITTGTLPVRYEIEKLTGSGPTSSNLIQICSTVLSEGGYDQPLMLFSNISNYSSAMTAGTWYPVVSIRLKSTTLDAVAQLRQVDLVCTSSDTVFWALWSRTSLTGGSFVAHSSSSIIEVNQGATAVSTSGAYQIAAGIISGTNQSAASVALQLDKYYSQIGRNSFTGQSDIMTLAFYSVTTVNGHPVTVQALLSWNELL